MLFFKTKLIFEIVLSILNSYYFFDGRRDIFSFSTFKVFLNYSFLYILVQYKLYWKNLFLEFNYVNFKKSFFLKQKWFVSLIKKKNFLVKAIKNKKAFILKNTIEKNLVTFILHFELNNNYKHIFKKIFFFFFFIPQFVFLKDFFVNTLNKINPLIEKKIFFLGLNQKNFNINDVLNLIELLLHYRFRPSFVLYKVIKILRFYKKNQKLHGFKFLLAGRFSRRDRATFLWRTFGAVSLGSRLSVINYYTRQIILPYSKCVAKIWLCQS